MTYLTILRHKLLEAYFILIRNTSVRWDKPADNADP